MGHIPRARTSLRPTLWRTLALLLLFAAVGLPHAHAAELKKDTAAAFDRYIAATEKRIDVEDHEGPFLYIDSLAESARAKAYQQLRNGQILLRQVDAKEEGHPIEVPHGLIHDWAGIAFIPGATLSQAVAVVQDYDHHSDIYKPDVRRSKLVSRSGDDFKIYLQFYKKTVVTVVLNANFDVHYDRIDDYRLVSRSHSTRIVEVENVDQPSERELAPDGGNGYMWRLNTYWRAVEKDGGVYIQMETIGLSRSVPAIVAWLVNPLLRSIPRGTLSSLLEATRKATINRPNPPPPQ